jgi:Reverse transcriptase (RNA-dependent DNA polymerase)
MCLPKGFQGEGGPGKCWHLWKSIYGLKQVSNIWYKKLKSVLVQLGFSVSTVNHALFHYSKEWRNTPVHCLLAMHVDDSAGGSNSRLFLEWVKEEIWKEFGIKDLGLISRFLGMQVKRDRKSGTLWIHQGEYIASRLQHARLQPCIHSHGLNIPIQQTKRTLPQSPRYPQRVSEDSRVNPLPGSMYKTGSGPHRRTVVPVLLLPPSMSLCHHQTCPPIPQGYSTLQNSIQ